MLIYTYIYFIQEYLYIERDIQNDIYLSIYLSIYLVILFMRHNDY